MLRDFRRDNGDKTQKGLSRFSAQRTASPLQYSSVAPRRVSHGFRPLLGSFYSASCIDHRRNGLGLKESIDLSFCVWLPHILTAVAIWYASWHQRGTYHLVAQTFVCSPPSRLSRPLLHYCKCQVLSQGHLIEARSYFSARTTHCIV